VPFFIIVMDATRFPKRAAAIGSPVTFSVRAAPAEKLSSGAADVHWVFDALRLYPRGSAPSDQLDAIGTAGDDQQRGFRQPPQFQVVDASERAPAGGRGFKPGCT